MKRLVLLTISLISALCAFTSATAFAAERETFYPENEDFIKTLTFTELGDFAVSAEEYAFSDGETVKVYKSGNLTEYSFEEKMTALDCADGTFYCSGEGGIVYSLPYEAGQEGVEHAMPADVSVINVGNYTYRLTDSTLMVADFSDPNEIKGHTFEGEYRNLKQYGEKVYAVNGNAVCILNGAESEQLTLEYADYTATGSILIGQAATALKTYSSPTVVTIKAGAYRTEADLTSLSGDFFVTGDTFDTKEDTPAVLLCKTGNAAIVAIGMDSFILNADNVTVNEGETGYSDPDYEYAKITSAGDRIYASPYVSEGTAILSGAAGITVKVLHKVEHSVLDTAFYEVEFTAKDGTVTRGYINGKFLIKTDYVKEDNKQPNTVTDPTYSEESNTKTVLIVFAVVILVLATVGFLAYTATSDKRKSKKGKKANPDPNNKS